MLTAESSELDRLRTVQRECAAAAIAAPAGREREYAMLGVNDKLDIRAAEHERKLEVQRLKRAARKAATVQAEC